LSTSPLYSGCASFAAAANISIGKARSAAIFQRPTRVFEDIIKGGRTSMVALNDFTPRQGGVPIVVAGQVLGAVGVSGTASAQQNEDIALDAASAFQSAHSTPQPSADVPKTAAPVTYIEGTQVAEAFASGLFRRQTFQQSE
jgi:glc operon protein GlcG